MTYATLPILAEGAREMGIELSQEQLGQFHRFYEVLMEWAQKVSLTAVKDAEGVQRRHFLESAAIIAVLREEGLSLEGASLIDVGSGAGIPGVPLRIIEPSLSLTLVEAKAKKSAFLNEVLPQIGLDDVTVIARRAEETAHVPRHRERYDFAVAKALAPLRTLVELTLPFVRMGGIVIAPKGKETENEVREAKTALEMLKGSVRLVEELPLSEPRQHVILIDKDLPIPPRFPRRPGMPAKRPL